MKKLEINNILIEKYKDKIKKIPISNKIIIPKHQGVFRKKDMKVVD